VRQAAAVRPAKLYLKGAEAAGLDPRDAEVWFERTLTAEP
jgi:hypothetical protein